MKPELLPPRPYQDASDLHKMCTLLQTGCSAQTNAYYIHPGELQLCLYHWLEGHNPWRSIYLWDDPARPERLLGWGLLLTPWSAFDVFVQPDLWQTEWADAVNAWVEARSMEQALIQGRQRLWRMNVAEADHYLREHLRRRGFQEFPEYTMHNLSCSLEEALPAPSLPAGFIIRPTLSTDAASRAAAHHAAFKLDTPWPEYLQGFQNFMASPGYAAGADWVVLAPDGAVAAFCTAWPDAVSLIGQVDPVGTHPGFQRQGLGRAILRAALLYLQSVGIHTARICVRADNVAAIKLYECAGFQMVYKLLTYLKLL